MAEHYKTKRELVEHAEKLEKVIELLELDRVNLTRQNCALVERVLYLEGPLTQDDEKHEREVFTVAATMAEAFDDEV